MESESFSKIWAQFMHNKKTELKDNGIDEDTIEMVLCDFESMKEEIMEFYSFIEGE